MRFGELIDDLAGVRYVFMGELHDHSGHHLAQLSVIRALNEKGVKVAIGLEMFRRSDQEVLDRWVAGLIPEEEFLEVYRRNWDIWEPYRPLFEFARSMRVPMVGLNIAREIVNKVGKSGFASLDREQMEALGGITCRLSPSYEQFIRRAMGNHAPSGKAFEHFCEAQLVWDKVMAMNLAAFSSVNEGTTVIVLSGSGHAWKHGIPEQIPEEAKGGFRVIIPEGSSAVGRLSVSSDDADYYWLDFGREGWEVR